MTNDRETNILQLGRGIFARLHELRPTPLSKEFWMSSLMNWSMRDNEFKINLFRLVDVLPTLSTSELIASHALEYLSASFRRQHPLLGWAAPRRAGVIQSALIARAVKASVKMLAKKFIAGETAQSALPVLQQLREQKTGFTIDLLGEFSVSEEEALIYLNRYLEALQILQKETPSWDTTPHIAEHPGEQSPICLSVKLSALYSQCSPLNLDRSVSIISERLSEIVREAKKISAQVYIDAEDCANNQVIYACYKKVFGSQEFCNVAYPGIVVQAYAKDSAATLQDLISFARNRSAPIAVRLVKGAYWDYELVTSTQSGHASPLFMTRTSCDTNYEKLTRSLFDNHSVCLPAIASHNIRSLAHACVYAQSKHIAPHQFELQMLYGMAESIATSFREQGYYTRLYVPLGDIYVGMGYLVRRLLENSSNESFLRASSELTVSPEELLRDPALQSE